MTRRRCVLLATLIVIAPALGLSGLHAFRKRQEVSAADQLQNAVVTWDYQLSKDGAFLPTADPPGTKWARELLGNHFFSSVREVTLALDHTDEEMRLVSCFRHLRRLNASGTKITDDGVGHLAGLSDLEILDLSATGVSDDGLLKLARLRNLRNLSVARTRVTGRGIQAFLPGLEALDISGSCVQFDASLSTDGLLSMRMEGASFSPEERNAISRMSSLEWLSLANGTLDDDLVEAISKLERLKVLIAADSDLNDGRAAILAQQSRLEAIDIAGTKVTEQGFLKITTLESIRTIDVSRTRVTEEAISRAKRERPEVEILTTTPKAD